MAPNNSDAVQFTLRYSSEGSRNGGWWNSSWSTDTALASLQGLNTADLNSSAGTNVYPRLYHSGSLLLPDATVALLGGNPVRGSYEGHVEIYSPAYLFNADGSPAARPTISGLSSTAIDFGSTFQVSTPDAGSIASLVLVRPGAPTHAFDMDQRLVRMNFTSAAGTLDVVAPPNGNIAPPGFYMLFALNAAGVPSTASFIRLGSAPVNQAPVAAIASPATNATIAAGQSVLFSGSGTDPDGTIGAYAWSFPGGHPPDVLHAWTPRSVVVDAVDIARFRWPDAALVVHLEDDERSLTESFTGHASYRYWLWNSLADAGYKVNFVGSDAGVANGIAR